MNLKKHITIILFFISILNCNSLFAQVYPVNSSVILTPPHPITYSKYTDIGSNSLQANLSFVDLNEPSWDVYISLTIESQDLKISTYPNFKPSIPITLYSGVPKILRGSDFYEYFDFNNVVFQNIDADRILLKGEHFFIIEDAASSNAFEIIFFDSTSSKITPTRAAFELISLTIPSLSIV